MKTIYKYPLEITDRQTVSLPPAADILAVQVQQGHICLWASLDPTTAEDDRIIRIIGTGHTLPEHAALRYIGTVQTPPFVWHVYEEV